MRVWAQDCLVPAEAETQTHMQTPALAQQCTEPSASILIPEPLVYWVTVHTCRALTAMENWTMGWVSGPRAASTFGMWAGSLLRSRSSADRALTWSLDGICACEAQSADARADAAGV